MPLDPEVIVSTVGGGTFCRDCYGDVKSPYDDDPEMFTTARAMDGACGCCGVRVGAGVILDNDEAVV